MDINKSKDFISKLISLSSSKGFSEAKASMNMDSSMEMMILNSEVSSFESSSSFGYIFAGKINDQMGISTTSRDDDEALAFLLDSAYENALIKNDEDEDFIYCDPDNSELFSSSLSEASYKNTYDKFKEVGLELEKALLGSDSRIIAVDYLSLSYSNDIKLLYNTKGLKLYRDSDIITIFAEVRCEFEGQVKTAADYWYGQDIDDFSIDDFTNKLKNKAIGKLNAKSISSGKYDIILGNEAALSLISSFFSSFEAYTIQKNLSILVGLEGEKIASSKLSIIEDPVFDKALFKTTFDNEGVKTTKKHLINKGVFESKLYNLKSANKDKCSSTGNGFGGTSLTNVYIKEGDLDFDGLLTKLGNGLYITELNGLHAGLNSLSGDFSLFCEGYLVKNGSIVRSVEQITISDNFLSLIKKIDEVGNDSVKDITSNGEVFVPSMIIKSVNIAGDN